MAPPPLSPRSDSSAPAPAGAATHALLISHATLPEGIQAADLSVLPALRQLAARWVVDEQATITLDAYSRSTPHEVVLARLLGMPADDGRIPWASLRARQLGLDKRLAQDSHDSHNAGDASQAWAFVTPCFWQPGADHLRMHDPAALQLSAGESATLREAMAPWFASEGITLQADPEHPQRWLACGEPLREVLTASLDRVSGRTLDAWMPEGTGARLVRRLQSEMQMLLYQHPLHDERRARGLQPVNSFWLHGAGASSAPTASGSSVVGLHALREAALANDAQGWLAALACIDARHVAPLCRTGTEGQGFTQLILCGERRAITLRPARAGLWQRISSTLRGSASPQALHTLLASL